MTEATNGRPRFSSGERTTGEFPHSLPGVRTEVVIFDNSEQMVQSLGSHDEALRLTPPPPVTLESALEFISGDELVEVTPLSIRLRKRLLAKHERERERGRAFDQARAAEREGAAAG